MTPSTRTHGTVTSCRSPSTSYQNRRDPDLPKRGLRALTVATNVRWPFAADTA